MKNRYGEDIEVVGRRLLQECAKIDGDAATVFDLIHRDADFSVEDAQGRTALIWAQLNRRTDLERMLRQKGFSPTNSKGERVIDGRLTTRAALEQEKREAEQAQEAQRWQMATNPSTQRVLRKVPTIRF